MNPVLVPPAELTAAVERRVAPPRMHISRTGVNRPLRHIRAMRCCRSFRRAGMVAGVRQAGAGPQRERAGEWAVANDARNMPLERERWVN